MSSEWCRDVIGLVFLIVLNLAIGYALALYRYQPDRLAIPWEWLPRRFAPRALVAGGAIGMDSSTALHTGNATTAPPPSPIVKPAQAPIATEVPPIVEPAPAEKPKLENVATQTPPPDPPSPQPPAIAATEALDPEAEKEAVESAVMAFKSELTKYCSQLGALDEKMRGQSTAPQEAQVKSCVAQFQELSSRYLEQQEKSVETLLSHASGPAADLAKPCLEAAQQHSAAVAATTAELSNVGGLVDAAAACREFLLTSGRLAEANQTLHQELDRTLDRIIESEKPTPDDSADSTSESQSKPTAAETLENAIREFVLIQSSPGGKFSVALVEIDQLAPLNKRYGRGVTDRILSAVVQTFVAQTPRSTVAKDKERQQFLFFQAEASAREITNDVELARKRIEAATFQHGDTPIKATLSCSVAEAKYDEEPPQVVQRLQEMLREAQRYGKNRTFFQEGEQSAPVIPPNVAVESRVIEI